jgi:CTP:molybdopterin cytidylyltransferase MocA
VLELGEGVSLRTFLRRHVEHLRTVDVADAGIHTDVDSPEDYRRMR